MDKLFDIVGWEHIGIRVSDIDKALKFYARLGFHLEELGQSGYGFELINKYGVRISLMANGEAQPKQHNILLDDAIKYPGVTHPAFVVASLEGITEKLNDAGITITEGPNITDRRRYIFIRDPDGNVLEFNELLDAA